MLFKLSTSLNYPTIAYVRKFYYGISSLAFLGYNIRPDRTVAVYSVVRF